MAPIMRTKSQTFRQYLPSGLLGIGAAIVLGAAWHGPAVSQSPPLWPRDSGLPLRAILPVAAQVVFSDVDNRTTQGAAIESMVAQGIMLGRSPTEFAPNASTTRGEFALAVQHMFNLPTLAQSAAIPDIPLGTQVYSAVQAIAPYYNQQLLCPGCALGQNFMPNQEISRGQRTVALVSILVAQNRLQLLGRADTDSVLANVADASTLSQPARAYFATAIKNGVVELTSGNRIDASLPVTRAELAVLLNSVQQKFSIPRAMTSP